MKLANVIYGVLVPLVYLLTSVSFRKELKTMEEKKVGTSVLKEMFCPAILFGETMIVKAVRA